MSLTDLSWNRCFTPAVYRRGVSYARQGRVGALVALDADGLRWTAEVKGTRVTPYRCEARVIAPRGRGVPTLISSCACPMGDACKHVAAMLSAAERGSEANKKFMAMFKEAFPKEYGKIRFPETSGIGIKPVSRDGSERLIRAAIEFAIGNKDKSLTLVHKGNIMKFTEGAFRNWGYALAEREFGDKVYTWDQWERTKAKDGEAAANAEQKAALAAGKVVIKDAIADITLQQVLTRPEEFDVIATLNLNGDYLSDALAAQIGGIGIAPGGNINYVTGHAVFEATHGTAPKYAGLDKVNPGSVVLSGEMMLRYMGWTEAADSIIHAMDVAIGNKKVTYDFARLMEGATEIKCSEFADELIKAM